MIKKLCFIGQVDCGKSTIGGCIIANCGGISKDELNSLVRKFEGKMEKVWPSIFDIYDEEREKSKTNEFSTLSFDYKNKKYAIIDNPGHQIYIRSLIEGISYFNANEIIGCVTISIRKGEFESGWINGQTKEDILLIRGVGIKNIVVIVNKMDTINWSQDEFIKIQNKIIPFLNICKFDSHVFIPISGVLGENITSLTKYLPWYEGKCLMDEIENIKLIEVLKSNIEFPDKWNSVQSSIRIIELKNLPLITEGFKCILHYNGKEYNITLDKVQLISKNNKNRNFLKIKDTGRIIFTLDDLYIIKQEINPTQLIFRTNEYTIGFGSIQKIIS